MIIFIIRLIIQTGLIFFITFIAGLFVKYKKVKVNYTRKIFHFSVFFIPLFLQQALTIDQSYLTFMVYFVCSILTLSLFIKPIRNSLFFFKIAFLAIDRPEDRPFTLKWLTLQIISSFIIIIPIAWFLYSSNKTYLLLIPLFINGLGDGLAEIIGVRFGKHKYNTFALFSKKKYTRSIEGSLIIFLTSFITVIAFRKNFTDLQFLIALISIPICMTITEALAPHSCDSPLIYLIGGFLIIIIINIKI